MIRTTQSTALTSLGEKTWQKNENGEARGGPAERKTSELPGIKAALVPDLPVIITLSNQTP